MKKKRSWSTTLCPFRAHLLHKRNSFYVKAAYSILTFSLILLIAFSLTSCDILNNAINSVFEVYTPSTTNNYQGLSQEIVGGNSTYEWKRSRIGYDCLNTQNQKDCYNRMKTAVYNVLNDPTAKGDYYTEKIRLEGITLPSNELRLVLTAFLEDHPEIFWISNGFEYVNDNQGTSFQMLSSYSGATLQEMIETFNLILDDILKKIPSYLNKYELEVYIHDYIIENCIYDKQAASKNDMGMSSSAYGALVDGKAVCEGYAKAFKLLLSYVGIESFNVTGMGKEELHLWTAVNLDNELNNEWYYVDVTWDDSDTSDKSGNYDYFNITTEQLEYDHTIAKKYAEFTANEINGYDMDYPANFNLFIPVCDSLTENYYRKNLTVIYDFSNNNEEQLKNALYESAYAKKGYINYLVDTDVYDFESVYQKLFKEESRYFRYIDDVNRKLDDYTIDSENVRASEKPHINVITILIAYSE